MANLDDLLKRKSQPKVTALPSEKVSEYLSLLPGWALAAEGDIRKTYSFKDFHKTMAFVNAVAEIAHGEDHHPDMEVGYNKCTVKFSTHSVDGLSDNDFISAAKVERLPRA